MTLKVLSLTAASALLFACSETSEPKAEETSTQEVKEVVETASYVANTDNSTVAWKGEVAGVYGHDGIVYLNEGNINMENDVITGGSFVVDMTRIIPTDSNSASYQSPEDIAKLVGHLSTDDFFATDQFPTSTFTITSVDGSNVMGDLTVRNKTNQETFVVESVENNNGEMTLKGKLVFDRQKYDVAWVHYMKDMILSDDISLDITLVANKK